MSGKKNIGKEKRSAAEKNLVSLKTEMAITDWLKMSEKFEKSVKGIGKMSGYMENLVLWHP